MLQLTLAALEWSTILILWTFIGTAVFGANYAFHVARKNKMLGADPVYEALCPVSLPSGNPASSRMRQE